MKIGILTYHAVYNFGANLQALSTFNFLKNNGHDPIIIDFFPELLEDAFERTVPANQGNAHKAFLKKYFILTKKCRNAREVATEIATNKIEAVIIGSDAVVQHYPFLSRIRICPSRKKILSFKIEPVHYETNFPNPFWGEFIDYLDRNINVVMMSVSCQDTDFKLITGRARQSINEMISKIKYISVRDNRTQEFFKHISNGSCVPKVTPDPVFAFNDNVFNFLGEKEILEKYNLPEKYILLSFNSSKTVSKSWLSAFETNAKLNGYNCVAFAMPGGIKFDNNFKHKVDIPLDPIDWYSIIKFSSAYIGEKMHPVIVSLHNIVPFFSFDHYGIIRFNFFLDQKASKIYQLLDKTKFTSYRISTKRPLNYNPPTPDSVLEKIYSFDYDYCKKFAEKMKIEYSDMMNSMIQSLG
jgi:hypothetical protein